MKIELPPKYYLDHFEELKSVLIEKYGPFFRTQHHKFFHDFDSLSEDARCLFLRLVNRKGHFFFKETLLYKEISDFESSMCELFDSQFAREVGPLDWKNFLMFLPKDKLIDLSLKRNLPVKKSWSRERLINSLEATPFEPFPEVIVQGRTEELKYLLFLYFGRIQENLSLYTLRDLGIRKTNKKESFKTRFTSLEDAEAHYFYSLLSRDDREAPPITEWPVPLNTESTQLREDLLLALADEHRKNQDYLLSLEVLKFSEAHPGREKRIRLLYQLDRKEECLGEINNVFEAPYNDAEYLFAEDFYGRKFEGKRQSVLTETLRSARKLSIDESYFRHPELGVEELFREKGIESFHHENYLWNALFGLLFWEELFQSEKTSLYNEFERVPRDLIRKEFHRLHEKEIQLKLETFSLETILAKADEKKGIPNGVFGWSEDLPRFLEHFLTHAPLTSVKFVLLEMTKDFMNRSTGFPDLLAIEDGRAKFYEIKAPGDVLKKTQLLQLLLLKKAGFEVEVIQVEYAFNPNQLYVVVDIETTGGQLPYHRITELGAVKVRNGEVIERFQSLVNPERFISREIQSLTGITNAMVKDAPKFRDVLEAFDEFTKGAIFVAHNVNFDYGFIQAEFEKCEKKFVRPFICTKALMKKYYPGLESYSLKNLCAQFGITLLTHHRALCDAEAAAGLLKLILLKRST